MLSLCAAGGKEAQRIFHRGHLVRLRDVVSQQVAPVQLCDELSPRDVQQSAELFAMLSNVTIGASALELR